MLLFVALTFLLLNELCWCCVTGPRSYLDSGYRQVMPSVISCTPPVIAGRHQLALWKMWMHFQIQLRTTLKVNVWWVTHRLRLGTRQNCSLVPPNGWVYVARIYTTEAIDLTSMLWLYPGPVNISYVCRP